MNKIIDPIRLVVTIPTRNRPDLAIRTFHSVFDQVAGRSVVIHISDNSTSSVDSERLRNYFSPGRFVGTELIKPPAALSMTAHWEWAVRQAMGIDAATHFAFITDRMLLRPGQLTHLMRVSELYREELISYTYDRINDLQNPLVFSPLPRSGKLYRLTSEDLLARSARMSFSSCLPRMLNSIAPRSHLDKLIGRFGSVFSSIAPDYCFCYRSLAVAASILYLDKSVLLNYAQARSNGGGLSRGALSKDGEDFLKNLGSVGLCHLTPLPEVATVGNAVIHEYLYVQREVQGAFPMLAREPYLQYLQDEVLRMVDSPGKQNMLDVIFAQGLRHQGRPLISSFLEKAALALLSSRFPTQDAALSYALAKSPLVWPHLDKVIHRYGKDTLADGA